MDNIHHKLTTNLVKVIEEALHMVNMTSPGLGGISLDTEVGQVLRHLTWKGFFQSQKTRQ